MYELHRGTANPASGWEAYELDVVAGDPGGEVHVLVDRVRGGQLLSAGVFRAEPGSWSAVNQHDEVILVLEGRARIEFDDGQVHELAPGDTATVPRGSRSTKHVLESYREFYVVVGPA